MPLHRRQQLAALCLGEGQLLRDVAAEAGVSTSQLKRWGRDPEFQELVAGCSDPRRAVYWRVLLTSEDARERMHAAWRLGQRGRPGDEASEEPVVIYVDELGECWEEEWHPAST